MANLKFKIAYFGHFVLCYISWQTTDFNPALKVVMGVQDVQVVGTIYTIVLAK